MIHSLPVNCLDLKQIADSGQCFRMVPVDNQAYQIISQGRLACFHQEDTSLFIDCPEEDLPFWTDYFDLSTDYQSILDSISKDDPYLSAAAQVGKGIRILRQELWEMVITFVISQQKTIPKIRELVEALCVRYGSRIDATSFLGLPMSQTASSYHAFPTPAQLSRASLEDLYALKLGYRAKYICRLCQDACSGRLDLKALSHMEYQEALDYLTGFYGIGKKVANCVCLFGLHHIDAFPVDTWIQKILLREYNSSQQYAKLPKSQLWDAIIADHFGSYQGCAGILQQYIFYYERLSQHKIG